MPRKHFPCLSISIDNFKHRFFTDATRRCWFVNAFLFCSFMSSGFAVGQEVTANLQAEVQPSEVLQEVTQQEADSQDSQSEDLEICRLVLKIDFPNVNNSAASRLRADIAAGVYDDYAISQTRSRRRKKSPKISVPVGRNRYRVWYGYSGKIRTAVLATAAAQSPIKKEKSSQVAQVAYVEKTESSDTNQDAKYPHRSSWWTVGKRYPDREAMVKHLSSGQHEGIFAIEWLETLTRDELHALHSDDHEKKVNWNHAVRTAAVTSKPVLNED